MIFDPGSTFRSLASNSACNLCLTLTIGGGNGMILGDLPTGIQRCYVYPSVSGLETTRIQYHTFVCTLGLFSTGFFLGCCIILWWILFLFFSHASFMMSGISKLPGTRHGA